MSSFWSAWIIILTVISIAALCWLLFSNRKTTYNNPEGKTGHVYDGIEEYDNPMPAWWIYLFVITIVFSIGYLIAYPGMGHFPGLLGWTQEGQWQREMDRAEQAYGPVFSKYAAMPVEEVINDPAAMKMGQRLFANNCAQCHGSDARGAFGFPNLTDNDWLYGGSPEQIKISIVDGRQGAMPGWAQALGDDGVMQVAQHVLSLSGRDHDAALAAEGAGKFQMFCAACHGPKGTGNHLFGAPNLTDDTWLYSPAPSQIIAIIRNGRQNRMPAHKDMLDSDKIHLLTAYVYQLSQPAAK